MFRGGGPGHGGMFEQETSKPTQVWPTLVRLAGLFKPYWLALLVVAVLIIGSTWMQVITPDLIGQSVDCFMTPATIQRLGVQMPGGQAASTNCWYKPLSPDATTADYVRGLGSLILILAGLYVAGAIMSGFQFYLMTWSGQHILKNLRVQVFRHLHRLSLSYYAANEAGNVMSRITNDMDTLQQAVNFVLISVASGGLLIIWLIYTMLRKSVPYALLSMAVLPFMIVVTFWISGHARRAFRRTRVEIGKVNAELQETIAGVREVQAFGREGANIENFRKVSGAYRDANVHAVSFTASLGPALEALGYLAIAIVTVSGGIALLRNQPLFGTTVSLGLVITFLGYSQRFNQPVVQISMLWANLQSAIAGAERIFGLLDTVPDVQDRPSAQPMPNIVGKVEFDHVKAAYEKGVLVLDDVSFAAESGQTVAIVGPTGAGKTTIANLIPRFYDVVSGAVRIDGLDVRDVTRATLRQQIGIVLQDTFLFSDTVMNNIRFGRPEATDEEVKEAAKLARMDEVIQRLPNGYDTLLGERGSGLSQGQRQLVAIARAALANPRILILDEATSSVDTRTERQIQRALDELLQGRTSFVIAHRLSTIRNADQVLVLEEGKIVERGKHEELLARRGAYYALYMKQFLRQEQDSGDGQGAAAMPAPAPSPAG